MTLDTQGEWIVYSPGDEKLVFKRDVGNLVNMPYIDVGDVTDAFAHANIKALQERPLKTV